MKRNVPIHREKGQKCYFNCRGGRPLPKICSPNSEYSEILHSLKLSAGYFIHVEFGAEA